MWYWLFVAASLITLTLGMVQGLFWWSLLGTGVLLTVGVTVELFAMYREERSLIVDAKKQTSPAAAGRPNTTSAR
jgi:hypothetical protein